MAEPDVKGDLPRVGSQLLRADHRALKHNASVMAWNSDERSFGVHASMAPGIALRSAPIHRDLAPTAPFDRLRGKPEMTMQTRAAVRR